MEKNAAAELNPKHIWSKINSLGPPFIHTDSLLSTLPIPQPWTTDKYSFFKFMLQEKSCDGQNGKASPTKPPCKHIRAPEKTLTVYK